MEAVVTDLVVEREGVEALVPLLGLEAGQEDGQEVEQEGGMEAGRSVLEGRVLGVAVSEESVQAAEWRHYDLV